MVNEHYMRQALHIAGFAAGRTSPNPLVGAVVVQSNRIVGQGWHRKAGTPHAEIHALNQAGELARGADLYVTLEPCNHYGRTGPCAEAIIQAGIKRAIVAMSDPNPIVSGQGIARMKLAGIEIEEGVLAQEAAKQNEAFIKWIATGMPFGVFKTAMTLDGKIAAVSGQSQWISGADARQYVHRLRDRYDAIFTGIGTIIADNPQLTTRLSEGGHNPVRVVADSLARIPLSATILNDGLARTIIAVSPRAPAVKIDQIRALGAEVVHIEETAGGLDLRQLFQWLGKQGITSVLVEGGAAVAASALNNNLIDKVCWFIAPKIIGGATAPGPIGGAGISELGNAVLLEDMEVQPIGSDTMITAYVARREGRDVYRTCGRIG